MIKLYKKLGNLRDSIPIDEKYYLLSQLKLADVKKGEVYLCYAETQARNEGLWKGDFAFYATLEIRASNMANTPHQKEDTGNDFVIAENRGDNIINHTDHYGIDTRIGGFTAIKNYPVLYINLWAKSGSTKASKGDKCYFKDNTSLGVFI